MNLEALTLDELFVALRAAAIAEYESKEGKSQHAATEAEGKSYAKSRTEMAVKNITGIA